MQPAHSTSAVWRDQIEAAYRLCNPSKLPDLLILLEKYQGREDVLFRGICAKYGLCVTRSDASAMLGPNPVAISDPAPTPNSFPAVPQVDAVHSTHDHGPCLGESPRAELYEPLGMETVSSQHSMASTGYAEAPLERAATCAQCMASSPNLRRGTGHFKEASYCESCWAGWASQTTDSPAPCHDESKATLSGIDLDLAACSSVETFDSALAGWTNMFRSAGGDLRTNTVVSFSAGRISCGNDLQSIIKAMGIQVHTASMSGLPSAAVAPPFAHANGDTAQPGFQVTWSLTPAAVTTVQLNTKARTIAVKGKRGALEPQSKLLITFFGAPLEIKAPTYINKSKGAPPSRDLREMLGRRS